MLEWNILLAGAPEAGKSTLCRAFLGGSEAVIKTQAMEYHGTMLVDLPGEYLTHPHLRRLFLSSAQNVRAILFLQAANAVPLGIPPGLLHTLPGQLVVGVITKVDLPDADIPRSEEFLRQQGICEPFFEISVHCPDTIAMLRAWLCGKGLLPEHAAA